MNCSFIKSHAVIICEECSLARSSLKKTFSGWLEDTVFMTSKQIKFLFIRPQESFALHLSQAKMSQTGPLIWTRANILNELRCLRMAAEFLDLSGRVYIAFVYAGQTTLVMVFRSVPDPMQ